jgi:hypothetical protein
MDNGDIEIDDDYDQIFVLLLYKRENDHRTIQELLMDRIIKYNWGKDHCHTNSIQER